MNITGQRGFSLIEILVAFMILAMSLTVLFRIFSGGLRNVALSQDYAEAELLAESRMAEVGAARLLVAGSSSGEWGQNYTWERIIEPYQASERPRKLITPIEAYKVTVKVSWRHARGDSQIVLSSIRLKPADRLQGRQG